MRTSTQVLIGVVPSGLFTLGALWLADHISGLFQATLLLCAAVGTCGLVLSLMDYPRNTARFVIALLVIGIFGMVAGGVVNGITALVQDARDDELGPPLLALWRVLLLCWLVFGPLIVGVYQIRRALHVLREGE